VPVTHLRVLKILDLQPRRGSLVDAVYASGPFADDPFKVAITGDPKEIGTALANMIEVQETTLHSRHDAREQTLAFQQRQRAQVSTFEHQQIECIEVRPLTSKEKIPKIAAAIRIEAADFSVENSALCTHSMGNFFGELRPRFENVAVAGDQLAAMPADVRQRRESIQFRFEAKLAVIEWFTDSEKPHGIVR
jgi:hypothetical protein